MLSKSIIEKIKKRYGKKDIHSGDCASIAMGIGIGETTVKRMLGLVGADSPERYRTPHLSTMNLLAQWLGYDSYKELLLELNEGQQASEFCSVMTIETARLAVGSQIQLRYEPGRVVVMTYIGEDQYMVNSAINSQLRIGDILRISHLVMGQEMIVREVIRGEINLGGYRAAKDGGLTLLEIIE